MNLDIMGVVFIICVVCMIYIAFATILLFLMVASDVDHPRRWFKR